MIQPDCVSFPPHNTARTVKISKRQQIVKEIFESEHSYIAQLNTIVNVSDISHQLLMATSIIPSTSFSPTQPLSSTVQLFLNPVRVNGLLPSDAITDIFANIEGILSVNGELFSCMRQHSLADAFTYLGPFLKLYSTYANNYQQALQSLQVIERVVRNTM